MTLVLEAIVAGATREVRTCGNHLSELLRRASKVVRILDEDAASDCPQCTREATRDERYERALGLSLGKVGVTAWGRHKSEHYDDSSSVWFAFNRRLSDAVVLERLARAGVTNLGERRCSCSHDCCGHTFSDGPWITRTKHRTLVRQSWARNI